MRLKTIFVGLMLVTLPTVAMAQQQTCEQRAAVLGQVVDDMARQRSVISMSEIEAASLKVQVKELQQQLQAANEKKETKEKK